MFSSLLRSTRRARKVSHDRDPSPFHTSPEASRGRAVGQAIQDDDIDEDEEDEDDEEAGLLHNYRSASRRGYFDQANAFEEDEDGEDNEDDINTPLLPIFSAPHLDRLPLYNITHAIRLLIVQKCETTLSWDQLRSPQVSQFLVKPIQNQIRTNHFNRATLCALLANCLQFQKEAQLQPGNVGVLRSRALMSELLAMRLVKEFSTRELIDALSYDFDPLQGMTPPTTAEASGQRTPGFPAQAGPQRGANQRAPAKSARVSTIEVALKAQAKRFLAHQLIVQHLEAIWAGAIVFHSEADNLHRKPSTSEQVPGHREGYGTVGEHSPSQLPADNILSRKGQHTVTSTKLNDDKPIARRSVTIYNPQDASLFKLSRLRVPRYRQIFSTLSFATMLGLFVAVLVDRSLYITPLELVFWFWSAGYMLDEIVGFTEQGFGLYILSFWNAFDLGILLLFVMYYCLRLYGIAVADQGKHAIANAAYDVLSTTAILLFPRLFSVLDHYRYFSQLLIAFRMMAQDLMAILILILISCSGFFVAFTLSFADERTDGSDVIYQLFQILMGFTPAAWEKWSTYNMLGKVNMTIFLIICHFLIVTILITVLTNSFMAIVQNANEEHQFLFAINTISMVKSDALFSYIAPTNVVGWLLSPLRYVMPFRQYVKLNRTVIKVSHFPMLFAIFAYERVILAHTVYGPEDLLEKRPKKQIQPLAFSINKAPDVVSPGGQRLFREPSVISLRKDQALEAVFRRPYVGSTVRTTANDMGIGRRSSVNVVDQWMQGAENEGGASPPLEQPRSVVERLEHQRPSFRRAVTADRLQVGRSRELSMADRSMISDTDLLSNMPPRRPYPINEVDEDLLTSNDTMPQETDADGDDENNDESEIAGPAIGESALSTVEKDGRTPHRDSDDEEFFQTPTAGGSPLMQFSSGQNPQFRRSPETTQGSRTPLHKAQQRARAQHNRKISSSTAFLVPQYYKDDESSSMNPLKTSKPSTAKHSVTRGQPAPNIQASSGHQTPKKGLARGRPIMPPRQKTAPSGIAGFGLAYMDRLPRTHRQPSFNARALDLASEIGDNRFAPGVGFDAGGISGMPNSFSEQLMREREFQRQAEQQRRENIEEEKSRTNRIMLARMHTLEEGFREVLKEIKDISRSNANSSRRDSDADVGPSFRHPGTPRSGGMEGRARKSAKKREQKTAEAKEPVVAVQTDENDNPVHRDEGSTGIDNRDEGEAIAGDQRPSTAVWTPQPGARSE